MDWQPIELTELDKRWIKTQEDTRNAIINAFAISNPEPKPVQEYTSEQKKVTHAMEVIGQVAKLYLKRGQPPVWLATTSEMNRVARRNMTQSMSKKVQANLYGCGTCKLPYIGKVRCQCKAEVKASKVKAEYLENRINDEVLVTSMRFMEVA